MSKKEKESLDNVVASLNTLYAKGGIVNLAKNRRIPVKKRTNRPSIDYVTDGGIPQGRLILFAGEKSSGKSTAAIQLGDLIAKKILYVDTEYTLTTDYIESLGCDPDKFDHCMPESTEKMCDIIREQVPNYDLIIMDSINNSASEEQLQKDADQKTMANRASVMAAQLPIIVGLLNQHNTTMIVVSQIRQNMDKSNKYDSDTVIPGGESLHHNSSMTLEFYPSTKEKDDKDDFSEGDVISGRNVRIICSKNKVGKAFRTVKIHFKFGEGYTEFEDVIAAAKRLNIITGSGAWLYFGEDMKFNGINKMKEVLSSDKETYDKIRKLTFERFDEKVL